MADEAKRVPARFYETPQGNEPEREWLKDLKTTGRRKIGFALKELEYGWPVGMPLCRSLGRGLWELRSSLPDGRIARVFSACTRPSWCSCMGSSKRSRRPRRRRSSWPGNERKGWSDDGDRTRE